MRVVLRVKKHDGVNEQAGELSTGDLATLTLFCQHMVRVNESTLVKRGIPEARLAGDLSNGLPLSCESYSDNELHELLHVLRPVILPRETASFSRVVGIASRAFPGYIRQRGKVLRRVFDHGEYHLYLQIRVDGVPVFDDATLKLWLNGEQYHADEEKRAAWRCFQAAVTPPKARALVVTQIASKLKALWELEHLATAILRAAK